MPTTRSIFDGPMPVDWHAPAAIVDRIVRLDELDGAVGIADFSRARGFDEIDATKAYVRLGEALGLDWAKAAALRVTGAME